MIQEEETSNGIEETGSVSGAETSLTTYVKSSGSSRAALGASTTMASSSTSSLGPSKNIHVSPQIPPPSQFQAAAAPSHEGHAQRRAGGSGSFGLGASTRTATSAARNNQSYRKQHKGKKGQWRPQLADEDAAAESVGVPVLSSVYLRSC